MSQTHWKKLTDPNYLGSWDFAEGEERILTISKVEQEKVIDMEKGGTAKKDCTIAHFVEDCKPMVLNKTNCKTISAIYNTPYIEDWAGKQIIVHVEKVRAFGKIEDGLRVIKHKPQVEKCADCGKGIIASGNYSAANIVKTSREKYGVSLCMDCGKERKNASKS